MQADLGVDQRLLRRVQPDARIAGVAHQVVAHHPADGLVVAGVGVEVEVVDAGVEADEDAGIAADAQRDAFLAEQGLQVLRYTNVDIHRNFNGVCEDILKHL